MLMSDLICFCRLGAVLVLYLVVLHSADTNSYNTGRFQAAGTTAAATMHSVLEMLVMQTTLTISLILFICVFCLSLYVACNIITWQLD